MSELKRLLSLYDAGVISEFQLGLEVAASFLSHKIGIEHHRLFCEYFSASEENRHIEKIEFICSASGRIVRSGISEESFNFVEGLRK